MNQRINLEFKSSKQMEARALSLYNREKHNKTKQGHYCIMHEVSDPRFRTIRKVAPPNGANKKCDA